MTFNYILSGATARGVRFLSEFEIGQTLIDNSRQQKTSQTQTIQSRRTWRQEAFNSWEGKVVGSPGFALEAYK